MEGNEGGRERVWERGEGRKIGWEGRGEGGRKDRGVGGRKGNEKGREE